MTDDELNALHFRIQIFSHRLIAATVQHKRANPGPNGPEDATHDDVMQLVTAIADGDQTIVPTSAELFMQSHVPAEIVSEAKEYLARVTPKAMATDREMAKRIRDGFNAWRRSNL